jgi:hypothetical protein
MSQRLLDHVCDPVKEDFDGLNVKTRLPHAVGLQADRFQVCVCMLHRRGALQSAGSGHRWRPLLLCGHGVRRQQGVWSRADGLWQHTWLQQYGSGSFGHRYVCGSVILWKWQCLDTAVSRCLGLELNILQPKPVQSIPLLSILHHTCSPHLLAGCAVSTHAAAATARPSLPGPHLPGGARRTWCSDRPVRLPCRHVPGSRHKQVSRYTEAT